MKFEKLGTNYAKFTFTVEPELFKKGLDHSFEKVKPNVEIKGFRKGHVPREMYDNKFGVESLYEDALNFVIGEFYPKAFEEKSIIIVGEGRPEFDFKDISVDESFEMSLVFPIKPEVTLGEYVGAEADPVDVTVTDEEVEQEVNGLLQSHNSLEPKEGDTLEDGDISIIDFEGFLGDEPFEGGKGENHELKIGSNSFIPGFEEQMVGMKTGEEKDVVVTFPEEYHSEDLAGKEAVFKVKLHEIKIEKKAELNDELVKSLKREGIETVEDLKEDIKNTLAKHKEDSEKNRVIGTAVKFAVDNAEVDIPIEMIDYEKQNMINQTEQSIKGQYGMEMEMYVQLMGMTMEQYEAEVARQAQDRVLTSLVIEAVSDKEDFEVTDDEVDAKVKEIAEMYQMKEEEVLKQVTREMVRREVQFNKTIDFLENSVKFKK